MLVLTTDCPLFFRWGRTGYILGLENCTSGNMHVFILMTRTAGAPIQDICECFLLVLSQHELLVIRWMIFLVFSLRKENWIAVLRLRFYSTREEPCLFCLSSEWSKPSTYLFTDYMSSACTWETQFSKNRDTSSEKENQLIQLEKHTNVFSHAPPSTLPLLSKTNIL